MSYHTILMLVAVHFVADFILQSDWMAQGKSKRWGLNRNMAAHIGVYSACLIPLGPLFALVNGVAHWITDAFTSRATSYLWQRNQRHAFFVVIGFDQVCHYAVLFATYEALTWL